MHLRYKYCGNTDVDDIVTVSGITFAEGFHRIVHGGRGDYVEFKETHLLPGALVMPEDVRWRMSNESVYYWEFRVNKALEVMVYFQRRPVAYADYVAGRWYIHPSNLRGFRSK